VADLWLPRALSGRPKGELGRPFGAGQQVCLCKWRNWPLATQSAHTKADYWRLASIQFHRPPPMPIRSPKLPNVSLLVPLGRQLITRAPQTRSSPARPTRKQTLVWAAGASPQSGKKWPNTVCRAPPLGLSVSEKAGRLQPDRKPGQRAASTQGN